MALYYSRYHSTVLKKDKEFAFAGTAGEPPSNLYVVDYTNYDHTPSWKVHNHGVGAATLQYHAAAGWLSIDVEERAENDKSSKRTMITLPKEVVDAVREMLNKQEVK